MKSLFEILGIENSEIHVSNLFAYYFNPDECGYEFLNKVLKTANFDTVQEGIKVFVKREAYFVLDGFNNYIDILLLIGDDINNPDRVICIENKVYSNEGLMQTARYKQIIEQNYPNAEKNYLYLIKNNSYTNLSDASFTILRYSVIAGILESLQTKLKFSDDFCDFYCKREENLFLEIEQNDKPISEDRNGLIDYLLWKINTDPQFENLFLRDCHSDNGGARFYQLAKHNWSFMDNDREMSLHIEGDWSYVKVHLETNPYIQFKRLESKIGKPGYNEYLALRDSMRKHFALISTQNIIQQKLRANAELSIAKFKFTADTYKTYLNQLIELSISIDSTFNSII